MESPTIICPYCNKEIPLTEAMSHQIRERLQKEFEERAKRKDEQIKQQEILLQEREKKLHTDRKSLDDAVSQRVKVESVRLEGEIKQRIEKQVHSQVADLTNQISEKDAKILEAQQTELDLRRKHRELEEKHRDIEIELNRKLDEERGKLISEFEAASKKREEAIAARQQEIMQRERELDEAAKKIDKEVEERIRAERTRLETEITQEIQKEAELELRDLHSQLEDSKGRLQKAQEAELQLRKERRELEESKKNFELEMNRKLDDERKRIVEQTTNALTEQFHLKDLDKEKLINDMKKQIEELKRRAEQGSQESQGEVLELELEDVLKTNFQLDRIEPVPRGTKGADILQRVHDQAGRYCGTIIWESKRTKSWNGRWVEKLKDDQRDAKAEIAVILSAALPVEIKTFGHMNGVWVTNYGSMLGLATALRLNLIQIAETNLAAVGKHEKMELLYGYLSGTAFRQKVEGIVEAFTALRKGLDDEKKAMARIWAKREREIERVTLNMATMYGDMQGIIGASLPEIRNLELKALASGDEPDTDAIPPEVSS